MKTHLFRAPRLSLAAYGQACLLTAILCLAGRPTDLAAQPVRVEIVNDTGFADSDIYFRVAGIDGTGDNTGMDPISVFTYIHTTSPTAMVPLTNLNDAVGPTSTITSTVSGRENVKVYAMDISNISSGQIFFQKGGTPFTFFNSAGGNYVAPSAAPNGALFRFDFAEFTILPENIGVSAVDWSYVDKFGFPVKIEWYRGATLLNSLFSHASTSTMAKSFASLELGSAIFGMQSSSETLEPWDPETDSADSFARIIAPYDLFPDSSPYTFPYASFARYLDSLVGMPVVTLSSKTPYATPTSPTKLYYAGYEVTVTKVPLSGTNDPDNPPGWVFTATPPATNPPANYTGAPGSSPYTDTFQFTIPMIGATYNIAQTAGTPVAAKRISGSTTTILNDNTILPVELGIAGDIFTGLNLGFFGSDIPTANNTVDWFIAGASPVPPPAPFAAARTAGGHSNDGFYNTYMALMYQFTDFYGYTYGERYTPGVLINPLPGDVIRITLLPDERLNSPEVTVANITNNSADLSWPPIPVLPNPTPSSPPPNVSEYEVTIVQPLDEATTVDVSTNGHTLTGLTEGTPYTVRVRAKGTGENDNPITSGYRLVSFATTGPIPTTPVVGDTSLIEFPISVPTDPFGTIKRIRLNGVDYLRSNNFQNSGNSPRIIASMGVNSYRVAAYTSETDVEDPVPVFYNWINFEISQGTGGSGMLSISNIEFVGQNPGYPIANTQNLPAPLPPITNYPASTTMAYLNIALAYGINGTFQTTDIANILPGGSDNYTSWISGFYTTDDWPNNLPNADPDGDTSNNTVEYGQARNPSLPDLAGAVNSEVVTNPSGGNFGRAKYTYRKTTSATELETEVFWSPDLATWSTTGLVDGGTVSGTGFNDVSVELDLNTNSEAFFDAKIVLP